MAARWSTAMSVASPAIVPQVPADAIAPAAAAASSAAAPTPPPVAPATLGVVAASGPLFSQTSRNVGAGGAIVLSALLLRDRRRRNAPRQRRAVQLLAKGGGQMVVDADLVDQATASQPQTPPPSDVVVVFDSSSAQAQAVISQVEQDCARAPKPVAFRTIPSSDASAIAALSAERGLRQQDVERMRRLHAVVAVLPSGAVLEDLESDAGPLLRELRYRTCLEAPTEEDRARLERSFFSPLRTLRERWWWNPMAMSVLARQLAEEDFVVIDGFLPEPLAHRLRDDNERLYRSSTMQQGATTGGTDRVGLPHRGDALKWIGYDGSIDPSTSESVGDYASCIEDAIDAMRQIASKEAPEVAEALGTIQYRSEAMLTCYPGESRARYFRHTDNSSGNGRLLTAIVYLNEGWEPGHGGELRLFHGGKENLKIKTEVQPLWNRLVLFWSDERCPHEVLSACRDRYACTVWYYNEKNPTIPQFQLGGEPLQAQGSPPPAAAAPPAPSAAPAAEAAAPSWPPPAAAPAEASAAATSWPPPPATAADAGSQPAPAAADASPGFADAAPPQFFFDGNDAQAAELANTVGVDSVNLREVGVAHAAMLKALGPEWAQKLYSGVDGLVAEAGSAFLVKSDGTILRDATKQSWMLEYELKYYQDVRPLTPETRERMDRKLFEPLEAIRSRAISSGELQPGQPWWGLPEAMDVWGKALSEEYFIVLDDFLPADACSALAATARKQRDSLERGKTDSNLSAAGRGDRISWVNPSQLQELGPLVDHLNAMVGGMMELEDPQVQARLSQVTALSDFMFAMYPGDVAEDARYIRHVDNEDGRNGRMLTCTFYLNEDWNVEEHGGQIRIFEPGQERVKADVAPKFNRLVAFFSDSSVPHEVLRARRERHAITVWYINQEQHLSYHSYSDAAAAAASVDALADSDEPQ